MHKILLIPALLLTLISTAQEFLTSDSAETLTLIIAPDDPFLDRIDGQWQSMVHQAWFVHSDTACLNIYGYQPTDIPKVSDEEMRERVRLLDEHTVMEMRYDGHIRGFIELYVSRKRELSSRVLGLSELYYPMIEEMLDRFDIPQEMKHLAIVESALNPTARSRAGAKGLWQFMYGTGKMFDLKVNSFEDDRFDPLQSTVAACRYLRHLYDLYGDWNLVLAAYNSGPGNVNKAIRRSGGKRDYWAIRNHLPKETRGYVPAFIAVNYMMTYHQEHNIYPLYNACAYYETDTVHVRQRLTFDQVSAYTGVDATLIASLNPMYLRFVIPAEPSAPRVLRLPAESIGVFLANEDSIYHHKPEQSTPLLSQEITEYHRVRSGEFLGSIANKYGVKVNDLMEWNGLRNTNIYPGQNLVVHRSATAVSASNTTGSAPNVTQQTQKPTQPAVVTDEGAYRYHVVRSGDTLWDIAKLYDGVTVNQLKELNSGLNFNRLKPGQKIKIGHAG